MIYLCIYLYAVGVIVTYGLSHEVADRRGSDSYATLAAMVACSILWPILVPVAVVSYYIARGFEARKKETDWATIKDEIRRGGRKPNVN